MNDHKARKIVMVATNDLRGDRRVLRHVAALREAGYDVTLAGKALDGNASAEGAEGSVLRVRPLFGKGPLFYAGFNLRLLWKLLREKVDLVWANDADTLPACAVAARWKGVPLVADMHEIMSEVPEVQGRGTVQRVWRWIERHYLPKAVVRLTVCQGLADHYEKQCGCTVTVVRNISEPMTLPFRETTGGPRTLLYQGAVNMGRGVDWAIDALEWLTDCRLVVAGGGDELEQMKVYAAAKPWAGRVEFLGWRSPDELPALMAQADVGLVMLEDRGLSYHYALPNRVGDFIQAGLPMVVSDLPEMAAVVRRYGVGAVMEAPGPKALAKAVREVLDMKPDFAEARKDFCWTNEKEKMLNEIKKIKI